MNDYEGPLRADNGDTGIPRPGGRSALRVRHPVQPDNTGHRRIAETALRGCRAGADRPAPDDGRSLE